MDTHGGACAQCGGVGTLRCAGCREVLYCGRACQKAAWAAHKHSCQFQMTHTFNGTQLASERAFVLEYWESLLPASVKADSLLPHGKQLDEAAAFERCRGAAMDELVPGFSTQWDTGLSARYDAVHHLSLLELARASGVIHSSGVEYAGGAIKRLCPDLLAKYLDAGVKPGDLIRGASLLAVAVDTLGKPYAQSAAVLPHALASLRLLLAFAQPSDWLLSYHHMNPLRMLATIKSPAVSQAVLDVIIESPGGFPSHAMDASRPGILHSAVQLSTPAWVEALLAAGADPGGVDTTPVAGRAIEIFRITPLHAMVLQNSRDDARDFCDKLRLLLDAGADLETTAKAGMTALLWAAINKRPTAFDALLAADAKASALCHNFGLDAARSVTLLHMLASMDNATMISRVVATGVLDVDARSGGDKTAAVKSQLLGSRTPLHVAALLDAPRAVGALLAAGASMAAVDATGMDALTLAISLGSAKAALLLAAALPSAAFPRAWYQDEARQVLAQRVREAAARPRDAAARERAAASLAAAKAIAAMVA